MYLTDLTSDDYAKAAETADILITSFQALRENAASFRDLTFRCEILDTFCFIRDPKSRMAETAGLVRAEAKIILTDPSTVARPDDVQNLFRFLMDDYLFDSLPADCRDVQSRHLHP